MTKACKRVGLGVGRSITWFLPRLYWFPVDRHI